MISVSASNCIEGDQVVVLRKQPTMGLRHTSLHRLFRIGCTQKTWLDSQCVAKQWSVHYSIGQLQVSGSVLVRCMYASASGEILFQTNKPILGGRWVCQTSISLSFGVSFVFPSSYQVYENISCLKLVLNFCKKTSANSTHANMYVCLRVQIEPQNLQSNIVSLSNHF